MSKIAELNGTYPNGVSRTRRKFISRRLLISFIILILIPTASISFVSIYLLQEGFVTSTTGSSAVFIIKVTSVVFFLLTIFFAYKLTRRIASPIEKLLNTANQINKGEYHLAAEIEQDDEVGNLAWVFNRIMAQHLNLIKKHDRLRSAMIDDTERQSIHITTAAEVSSIACHQYDTADLLQNAVNLIHNRFCVYFTGIFLISENQEYAELIAAAGNAGSEFMKSSYQIKVGDEGLVGLTLSTGQLKVVLDASTDKDYRRNPLLPDTVSEIVLPLKIGEKIIGALDIQAADGSVFDQNTINLLQIMADQLTLALENADLMHQKELILDQIQTGYGEYTLRSWHDYIKRKAKSIQYSWRAEDPDSAEETAHLQEQEGITTENSPHTATQPEEQVAGEEPIKNIAIPMKIRGQTIGVTHIKLKEGETTPETTALFVEIVNRLSLTLENVRLLEEAQLRGEQLHLLQKITSAAAANINLSELLEAVCQQIMEGFRLSRCGVLMLNEDKTEATLVVDEQKGMPVRIMRGARIPVYENETLQEFLYLQKSGISEDVQNNPSALLMQEFFSQRGTNNLLIVPLTSRGETVGLVLMESDDLNRQFSEEDLRLADQIGLQVSTAIDVAYLFEQTEQRAEKEKLISDVTTKIRETLDIETVIKTAAREIRRALNLEEVEIRLGTDDMSRQNINRD
jgi:GAF domain-containing protein/HAMP domain-containing protein